MIRKVLVFSVGCLITQGAFCVDTSSASKQVASVEYVDRKMDTAVTTSGNQEISGVKTYTESPIAPTPALP